MELKPFNGTLDDPSASLKPFNGQLDTPTQATPATPAIARPSGFIESAKAGFQRALPETKSLLYGAGAAVAGAVGADGLRDKALEGYQRVQKEEVAPLQGESSFLGSLKGETSFGDWAGDTLGNFGGQALQSLAAAGAGALVGGAAGTAVPGAGNLAGGVGGAVAGAIARPLVKKAVGKKIAEMVAEGATKQAVGQAALKRAGMIAAPAALNIAQETGIGFTGRAEDAQKSGEQLNQTDALRAIGYGVPAGLIDTAAEALVASRLLKGSGTSPSMVKRVAGGAAKGAATEGGTEGVQAVLERAGAARDLTGKDAYTDYIENVAAGALGGSVAGGGGSVRKARVIDDVLKQHGQEPQNKPDFTADANGNATVNPSRTPRGKGPQPADTAAQDPFAGYSTQTDTSEPLSGVAAPLGGEIIPQQPAQAAQEPQTPAAQMAANMRMQAQIQRANAKTVLGRAAADVTDMQADAVAADPFDLSDMGATPNDEAPADGFTRLGAIAQGLNLDPEAIVAAARADVGDDPQYSLDGLDDRILTTYAQSLASTAQPAQAQDGFPSEGAGGSQPTPVQAPTVEAQSGQANPVEGGGLAVESPVVAGDEPALASVPAAGTQAQEVSTASNAYPQEGAETRAIAASEQPEYDESEDILDSDITTPSGTPFTIRDAADRAAARHEGGRVFPVDGGFVVRVPSPQASSSGRSEAPQPVPVAGQAQAAPAPTALPVQEDRAQDAQAVPGSGLAAAQAADSSPSPPGTPVDVRQQLIAETKRIPVGGLSRSQFDAEYAAQELAIDEALSAGISDEAIYLAVHDGGRGLPSAKIRALIPAPAAGKQAPAATEQPASGGIDEAAVRAAYNAAMQAKTGVTNFDYGKGVFGDLIVGALNRDPEVVESARSSLINGSNETGLRVFFQQAGMKMPRTQREQRAAFDAYIGVTPEQRAARDKAKADSAASQAADKAMKSARSGAASVSMHSPDGKSVDGATWVDGLVAEGYSIIVQRGVATYLAKRDGRGYKMPHKAIAAYARLAAKSATEAKPETTTAEQPAATHADPGEAPEAVTPAVIADAAKTADRAPTVSMAEARKVLLAKLDAAIKAAPNEGVLDNPPTTKAGKNNGRKAWEVNIGRTLDNGLNVPALTIAESHDGNTYSIGLGGKTLPVGHKDNTLAKEGSLLAARLTAARMQQGADWKASGTNGKWTFNPVPASNTDMITLDVPGDGTFMVKNTKERLTAFRKQVESFFKLPKQETPKPESLTVSQAARDKIMAEAETVDEAAPEQPAPSQQQADRYEEMSADDLRIEGRVRGIKTAKAMGAARLKAELRAKDAASAARKAAGDKALAAWRETVTDLKGKQPWEMSRAEWERARAGVEAAIKRSPGMDMSSLTAAEAAFKDVFGFGPSPDGNGRHEIAVLRALEAGKPVPERVRAEYRGHEDEHFSSERRSAESMRDLLAKPAPSADRGEVLESVEAIDQTETPEFKRWSRNAPVIDADGMWSDYEGGPAVFRLFHGTTADFEVFDRDRANAESDMGAGFYFSNTADDVGNNYAGIGPDLTNKIEREVERLAGERDADYNDPDIRAEARAKWVQHEGATMPVFVRTMNPAIVGGPNETNLTYEEAYDEETDEYSEPEGTLVKFIESLREAAGYYNDGDVEGAISQLLDQGMDGDIALSKVIETLKSSEELSYYTDDNGDLVSSEIIRQALEWAGFDAVVDYTVDQKFGSQRGAGKKMAGIGDETVHVIAFDPKQIKSATGNKGTFDPENPSIIEDVQELSDADLTPAERASRDRQSVDKKGLQGELNRQRGQRDAEASGLADRVAAMLGGADIKIVYARDVGGLVGLVPQGFVGQRMDLQASRSGSNLVTAGLYVPGSISNDGKPFVVVYTGNGLPVSMQIFAAAHEIAGHDGLRKLLGPRLRAVLDLAAQNPTVRKVADSMFRTRKYAERIADPQDAMTADQAHYEVIEEALADLAAAVRTKNFQRIKDKHGVEVPKVMQSRVRSMLDAIVQRIKELFRRKDVRFSDGQVRELLENAWSAAQKPEASIGTPESALESTEGGSLVGMDLSQTKVVGKDGKPLTVFHGTPGTMNNKPLTKFAKQSRGGLGGTIGFWFATTRQAAQVFARERYAGVKPQVVEAKLDIRNPKEYDGHQAFVRAANDRPGNTIEARLKSLRRVLVRAGHDGVVIRNSDTDNGGVRDDWVAFEPQQIITQPEVLESSEDQTQSEAFRRWFGKSKVVDADGNPLVVYHGGAGGIRVFEPERAGSVKTADWGSGVYFTPAKWQAQSYMEDSNKAADVKSNALWSKMEETAARYGTGVMSASMDLSSKKITQEQYDEIKAIESEWRQARQDAEKNGSGEVYAAYLRIENPLIQRYDGITDPYLREHAEAKGHDGIIIVHDDGSFDEIVVFRPNQIKSATGNSGNFDPNNPSILESVEADDMASTLGNATGSIRDVKLPAGYLLGDLLGKGQGGALNWWHKSVGTMFNLAKREPLFKRVFDSVQNMVADISHYANGAMDLAPDVLPKFDSMRDALKKQPMSGPDAKKVSSAVFDGTLKWGRDGNGDIVPASDKVKAGVVWTAEELRQRFGMSDKQIGLYQQVRASIDRSLDDTATTQMIRHAGDDAMEVRDQMLAAPTAQAAADILEKHLVDQIKLMQGDARSKGLQETAEQVQQIAKQISKLKSAGYAPLSRFGRFTVYKDGENPIFLMFETQREANRAARILREKHGAKVKQGTMSQEQFKLFKGMTPETLELFGEILGLDKTGSEQDDMVFQSFLKAAKSNRSALKRLIHRQGIEGYSEDVSRVLASFLYSNARLAATNLHAPETQRAINEIPKEQGELKDAAIRLNEYIVNPDDAGAFLSSFNFAQYLGGSIASAMVNMTQPLTMSFPWLSQYGGAWNAAKHLGEAVKLVGKGGDTGNHLLDEALKRADADGHTQPQEVHQLQALAAGKGNLRSGDGTKAGDALARAQNARARLSVLWGVPFSLAEQFNRRSTFIAAFNIASEQRMADPYGFAVNAVQTTQGIYNKANRPAWSRNAIGGMAFTFKTYSINYVEMLHRMWTQGGKEGKQGVMLAMGVLFLLSGAGGLPGSDDLDDLLDGVMQRFGYNFSTKQEREEFFASLFGETGAKFMEHGLSSLPGMPIDVSGRLGMGNLIPSTGLFVRKDDHTRDVAEIAGPTGDFIKRSGEALGQLAEGNLGASMLAIAPRAAANAWKGIEMANTGEYRDTRGRKVLETTGLEAASKFIGFQPASVAKVQQASGAVMDLMSNYRIVSASIADRWAKGIYEQDPGEVLLAQKELADWNAKNHDMPIRIGRNALRSRVRNLAMDRRQRLAKTTPRAVRGQVESMLENDTETRRMRRLRERLTDTEDAE